MTRQERRRVDDPFGALGEAADVSQDEVGRFETEAAPGLVSRQAAGEVGGIDAVGDDRSRNPSQRRSFTSRLTATTWSVTGRQPSSSRRVKSPSPWATYSPSLGRQWASHLPRSYGPQNMRTSHSRATHRTASRPPRVTGI